MFDDESVDLLVDFISSDACFDKRMTVIESLSCQKSDFSHFFNVFFRIDLYLFLKLRLLLLFRDRREIVVGFYNFLGNGSFSRYDSRPERPCELESAVFLFCLLLFRNVTKLMNGPCGLEAVLRAEERIVDIHLFTNGALHTGLLATSGCPAFCVYFHVDFIN